ncbi:MAG: hypothetical protein JJU06_05925 [Ectothiorhodospiraceae bacterium]|nr:hypothetical protein [Ectothiorhodospiraceae bacterium]MCH8506769.1 hypothetical protein [Ectothiorhodospiraceae bacterium]
MAQHPAPSHIPMPALDRMIDQLVEQGIAVNERGQLVARQSLRRGQEHTQNHHRRGFLRRWRQQPTDA